MRMRAWAALPAASGWLNAVKAVIAFTLLSTFGIGVKALTATGSANLLPQKTAVFNITAIPSASSAHVGNGFATRFGSTESAAPISVSVLSLANAQETVFQFWIPNSSTVQLYSVTAIGQALIGASGTRVGTDGNPRAFYATADFSGKIVQAVDTGSFVTEQSCAAPDGHVWLLGADLNADGERHDFYLLREMDGNGAVVGTRFARSTVPGFSTGIVEALLPANSFISCGQDSVGVYLNKATTPIWFESPYIGTSASGASWIVKSAPAGDTVTGGSSAVLHSVVASFFSQPNSGGTYGLVFTPDGAEWKLLFGARNRVMSTSMRVLGSDGTNVVYDSGGNSLQQFGGTLSMAWAPTPAAGTAINPPKPTTNPNLVGSTPVTPHLPGTPDFTGNNVANDVAKALSFYNQFHSDCSKLGIGNQAQCNVYMSQIYAAGSAWEVARAKDQQSPTLDVQTQTLIYEGYSEIQTLFNGSISPVPPPDPTPITSPLSYLGTDRLPENQSLFRVAFRGRFIKVDDNTSPCDKCKADQKILQQACAIGAMTGNFDACDAANQKEMDCNTICSSKTKAC